MRKSLLLLCLVLLLGVGAVACSSKKEDTTKKDDTEEKSDDDKSDGKTTVSLPDPCDLLTETEITTLLGSSPTPDEYDFGGEKEAPMAACTWGSLIDGTGLVAVQVGIPDEGGIDRLQTLSSSARKIEDVNIGTDGALLDLALIPGGGGVGKSVKFEQGDMTVVVAQTGENVNVENLKAAAAAAEKNT